MVGHLKVPSEQTTRLLEQMSFRHVRLNGCLASILSTMFDKSQTKHGSANSILTVEHSEEGVIIQVCFAATGPGQL